MALSTNGVLTLATINFNEIAPGEYTFASADPNFPNQLLIASSVTAAGRRDIKIERRQALAGSATDVAGVFRAYTVIQIPRHSAMIDATINASLSQIAGLYTTTNLAAMRRGER